MNKTELHGLIVQASDVTAHAVPCYPGGVIPSYEGMQDEHIADRKEFFYPTEFTDACLSLIDHKVTLFAPEVCCDTGSKGGVCASQQRVLVPLPIEAQ